METQEIDFTSSDSKKLFLRFWTISSPKAVVQIVHGFGEYSKRYEILANHLCKQNIAVICMDLRGHGKSSGMRGHASNLDVILNDIEEVLKIVRCEYNNVPIFLMGHSMGGNLVLNYLLKMPISEIQGFIISSPWLKLAFEPPKWKTIAGKILSKILPFIRVPSNLDVNYLSRDKEEINKYANDPMIVKVISAGLFQSIVNGGKYVIENAHNISLKGLMYQGTSDKITCFETCKQVSQKIKNVDWIEYEGSYHETHNDLDKQKVMENLSNWILKNC